jgi:hypothetical protein
MQSSTWEYFSRLSGIKGSPIIPEDAIRMADWEVLVEKEGAERLYFVIETKSSLFTDDLDSGGQIGTSGQFRHPPGRSHRPPAFSPPATK